MAPPRGSGRKRLDDIHWEEKRICVDVGPEALVGERVKIWWEGEHKAFEGTVKSFDEACWKHTVIYDDGDEQEELLVMEKVRVHKKDWPAPPSSLLVSLGAFLTHLAEEAEKEQGGRSARSRNVEGATKAKQLLQCAQLVMEQADLREEAERQEQEGQQQQGQEGHEQGQQQGQEGTEQVQQQGQEGKEQVQQQGQEGTEQGQQQGLELQQRQGQAGSADEHEHRSCAAAGDEVLSEPDLEIVEAEGVKRKPKRAAEGQRKRERGPVGKASPKAKRQQRQQRQQEVEEDVVDVSELPDEAGASAVGCKRQRGAGKGAAGRGAAGRTGAKLEAAAEAEAAGAAAGVDEAAAEAEAGGAAAGADEAAAEAEAGGAAAGADEAAAEAVVVSSAPADGGDVAAVAAEGSPGTQPAGGHGAEADDTKPTPTPKKRGRPKKVRVPAPEQLEEAAGSPGPGSREPVAVEPRSLRIKRPRVQEDQGEAAAAEAPRVKRKYVRKAQALALQAQAQAQLGTEQLAAGEHAAEAEPAPASGHCQEKPGGGGGAGALNLNPNVDWQQPDGQGSAPAASDPQGQGAATAGPLGLDPALPEAAAGADPSSPPMVLSSSRLMEILMKCTNMPAPAATGTAGRAAPPPAQQQTPGTQQQKDEQLVLELFQDVPGLFDWVTSVPDSASLARFSDWAERLSYVITDVPLPNMPPGSKVLPMQEALDIIKALEEHPVNLGLLHGTQICKAVAMLRSHRNLNIAQPANHLCSAWRATTLAVAQRTNAGLAQGGPKRGGPKRTPRESF